MFSLEQNILGRFDRSNDPTNVVPLTLSRHPNINGSSAVFKIIYEWNTYEGIMEVLMILMGYILFIDEFSIKPSHGKVTNPFW